MRFVHCNIIRISALRPENGSSFRRFASNGIRNAANGVRSSPQRRSGALVQPYMCLPTGYFHPAAK